MITSIDAGLRGCGVAVWSDDGILVRAAYVQGAVKKRGCPLPVRAIAWREMADAVGRYWGQEPDLLVIEAMKTYGGRAKGNADTNDLLDVNAVVGSIAMLSPNTRVYLPQEWKGGTQKFVDVAGKRYNPIAERVKLTLSEIEMARVDFPSAKSLQHNVYDALGIGLHYLGLKRLRSCPQVAHTVDKSPELVEKL